MTNLRPRKVTHKGRVEAAGFLFDTDLIGVAETRRRILNLWESGMQVFADGPNHFVRLSSTIRVDSAHSVATPLVKVEDVLSALPLSQDELELLQAPSHSVFFAKGGVVQVVQLSSSTVESPEKWLDVAAFAVVEVTTLGAAFAEPKVTAEPLPFDARAKLDGVPEEASELREAIAAIKSAASGNAKPSSDWNAVDQIRGWLGGVIGFVSSEIRQRLGSQKLATSSRHTTFGQASDQGSRGNGWLTRLGMQIG